MFADSLQSRINALTTDFVNRDNPVERQKIEETRKASLAELERVKKELADHAKTIADIEDEARRANVPAAWLRPR
jgi:flagellar motor switch protein FliM